MVPWQSMAIDVVGSTLVNLSIRFVAFICTEILKFSGRRSPTDGDGRCGDGRGVTVVVPIKKSGVSQPFALHISPKLHVWHWFRRRQLASVGQAYPK